MTTPLRSQPGSEAVAGAAARALREQILRERKARSKNRRKGRKKRSKGKNKSQRKAQAETDKVGKGAKRKGPRVTLKVIGRKDRHDPGRSQELPGQKRKKSKQALKRPSKARGPWKIPIREYVRKNISNSAVLLLDPDGLWKALEAKRKKGAFVKLLPPSRSEPTLAVGRGFGSARDYAWVQVRDKPGSSASRSTGSKKKGPSKKKKGQCREPWMVQGGSPGLGKRR